MCWLLFLLCTVPPYQLVLIQNPPCIPAVVVAWLMSKCNGSRIIVDWHNLGFSMFLTEAGDVRRAVKEGLTAPLPSRFASMTRWVTC